LGSIYFLASRLGQHRYIFLLKSAVHAGNVGAQEIGHARRLAEGNGADFYTQENISMSAT
jgi:hypothetical protein